MFDSTHREPRRCKLVVGEKITEQVMAFQYLTIQLSSHGDRNNEV